VTHNSSIGCLVFSFLSTKLAFSLLFFLLFFPMPRDALVATILHHPRDYIPFPPLTSGPERFSFKYPTPGACQSSRCTTVSLPPHLRICFSLLWFVLFPNVRIPNIFWVYEPFIRMTSRLELVVLAKIHIFLLFPHVRHFFFPLLLTEKSLFKGPLFSSTPETMRRKLRRDSAACFLSLFAENFSLSSLSAAHPLVFRTPSRVFILWL